LQYAFPLDVPMVHSSVLTVSTDGERLTCDGFSLSEIIHFGSPEFIAIYFNGLSLYPRGMTQAPPSWAQPATGHHRYGP
jgi:hypothetical protein